VRWDGSCHLTGAHKIAPVPYAKLENPQTLNLYAYVGNNPLVKVDADGHAAAGSGCRQGKAACDAAIQKSNADFKKNAEKLAKDTSKLLDHTKVSVEVGAGVEAKGTVAGTSVKRGVSLHVKIELSGSGERSVGLEGDAGLSANVGGKEVGGEGAASLSVASKDGETKVIPDAEFSGAGGSGKLNNGGEVSFGAAAYDGWGGGGSASFRASDAETAGKDVLGLIGIGGGSQ
jgi:hypothetical protein